MAGAGGFPLAVKDDPTRHQLSENQHVAVIHGLNWQIKPI